MSNKDISKSLGFDLNVLEEAKRMKDNGASNTQLRAYLEEHGMSDIVFDTNDVGINPGMPVANDIHLTTSLDQLNITANAVLQRYDEIVGQLDSSKVPAEKLQLLGPDRNKADAFDFAHPLRHHGVLSGIVQTDPAHKNMPNKSVGESEMGSGLRGVYFPEHSLEENLGMKLPDELAERLRNTDFSQAPSPVSEEFSVIYAKEAMARRRYKAIILSINLKLKKGPLAEFVYIKGIRKINPHTYVVECAYPQGKTFRAMNRMKTFRPYLGDIVYFAYFDHLTTEEHLAIREIRYT